MRLLLVSVRTKKKRQHYVPRRILRNFSEDKRTLCVYIFSSGKRIDGASVRGQCYRNYFYGRSPNLEDTFTSEENKFAAALGDMSISHLESLGDDELLQIKLFVHYQRHRTFSISESINDVCETVLKTIASQDKNLSNIDSNEYRIRLRAPQALTLINAAALTPLLSDLDVKFIVNKKATGFVISDAPVTTYNQFAEHHPKFCNYRGYKGLAFKGLQLFYPITPTLCIAVYDPTTYKYGSPKRRICTPGLRDVYLLNSLQALHAKNCIYFLPKYTSDEHLEALQTVRSSHPDLRIPLQNEGESSSGPDEIMTLNINFSTPDPKIGAKFHFVEVIEKDRYRGYNSARLPIRSQELLELSKGYRAFLDQEIALRRSAKDNSRED